MGMARYTSVAKNIKIANGDTKSSAIILDQLAFAMLQMPAAITGTAYTLEGSLDDDDDWQVLVGLAITHTNNGLIRIPDAAFGCFKIRLVSDATEGAERVFKARLSA